MQEIDQRDRELLGALQGEIPLVSTPFAILGQQIDMSEKEVLKRIERLRREGLVRQLAPLFDMRALGYRSSLVAARVDPQRVDDAAAIVNAHPGVTQNYRRNHDFNLWFTIAVPPDSKLGLEKTIEILGEQAECLAVRPLPTLRQYKSSGPDGSEIFGESETGPEPGPLDASTIEAVRLLQCDLPLQPRPFDALGRIAGLGGEELIAAAKLLLARGQMRRFGAIVQPKRSGFSASAMGVWAVAPERADEFGARLSQNHAVSHCYLRPTYDDWPYNLYTIVHGRSVDECESVINDLAIDTGLEEKRALYPTKEYKRARINFFSRDAEKWEEAHTPPRAQSAAS